MKYITVPGIKQPVSQVALGCMRIGGMTDKQVDAYLAGAIDIGYNYFDHADIYGGGQCERVFGAALRRNPAWKEKIVVQTKCGIRAGMYDFSKEHIISAAEGSLSRLGVEKIDVLLLHRPDLLMEPQEVAEAFDVLYTSGKVGAFGVSNHSPSQIELLKTAVKQPLVINQLQLSLTNASLIASGANVNHSDAYGVDRDGYVRDYCRLHGITIQPWSPLQHGFFQGPFLGSDQFPVLNEKIAEMAEKYRVSDTGIAIAWLLRLPERMQPVVGSIHEKRLAQIAAAADITLSKEDWYALYRAAGYCLP